MAACKCVRWCHTQDARRTHALTHTQTHTHREKHQTKGRGGVALRKSLWLVPVLAFALPGPLGKARRGTYQYTYTYGNQYAAACTLPVSAGSGGTGDQQVCSVFWPGRPGLPELKQASRVFSATRRPCPGCQSPCFALIRVAVLQGDEVYARLM